MSKKEEKIIAIMEAEIKTYMEQAKQYEYGSNKYRYCVSRISHAQEIIWLLTDNKYLAKLERIWL